MCFACDVQLERVGKAHSQMPFTKDSTPHYPKFSIRFAAGAAPDFPKALIRRRRCKARVGLGLVFRDQLIIAARYIHQLHRFWHLVQLM